MAASVLALCFSATPAVAGPPSKGQTKGQTTKGKTHKGNHKWPAALMQRFENFGNLFAMAKAVKKKNNRAKSRDDYWVMINPGPGGLPGGETLYLCKKKGKKPPTECDDPGPRPPSPPGGFTPPCTFCDPGAKDDLWDDYIEKQIAADALHKLLEMLKEGQFWGLFGGMLSNMYDALSTLSGPGSVLFKAAKWGAGEALGAATDAAKEAAMAKFLQGILDTLGLDLDPDDISTEGGLNAAIALADGIAKDARDKWRAAYDLWAKCRSDAVGAGKMPTDTQGEADQCNADAQAAANAQAQAAWNAIFAWEAAMFTYQKCIEYNDDLEFETAVWQSTPC